MGWISIRAEIGVVKRVYIGVPWGQVLIRPWTHWRTIVGWGRQWTMTLRGHGRRGRRLSATKLRTWSFSVELALDHDQIC